MGKQKMTLAEAIERIEEYYELCIAFTIVVAKD